MILISAAGVGVAILLLIAAIVTSNLLFVSIGIGVSVASALLLAMGALREFARMRRGSSAAAGAGSAGEAAVARVSAAGGSAAAGALLTPAPVPMSAGRPSSYPTGTSVRVADVPDTEIVFVLPGRRRFHRPGCTGLARRLTEELTLDEALEEGFSPCSVCHPEAVPGSWEVEAPLAEFPTAWLASAGDGAPGNAGAEVKAETAGDSRTGETAEGSPAGAETAGDSRTGPPAAAAGEGPPAAAAAEGPPAAAEGPPAAAGDRWAGQTAEGSPARAETAGDSPTSETARGWPTSETAEGWPGPAADDDSRTGATTGAQRSGEDGSSAAPDTTVHVVRGVSRHHLADCVLIHVVDSEDVDTMTLAEAEAAGCTPCRACHSG